MNLTINSIICFCLLNFPIHAIKPLEIGGTLNGYVDAGEGKVYYSVGLMPNITFIFRNNLFIQPELGYNFYGATDHDDPWSSPIVPKAVHSFIFGSNFGFVLNGDKQINPLLAIGIMQRNSFLPENIIGDSNSTFVDGNATILQAFSGLKFNIENSGIITPILKLEYKLHGNDFWSKDQVHFIITSVSVFLV